MIRMTVADLRVMGRNTQGVRLIRLNDDDEISSIARIDIQEEASEEAGAEGGETSGPAEDASSGLGENEPNA